MFGNLSGPTLLVILFIVLLLFGAPKLPGLAKSIGQSMRILKKEVQTDGDDSGADSAQSAKTDASNPSAGTASNRTAHPASNPTTNDAPTTGTPQSNQQSGENPSNAS